MQIVLLQLADNSLPPTEFILQILRGFFGF